MNNALKAGIRFNGTVKSYALNNSNRTVDNYLVKTENQLGGYIDYNYKNVHLNLFGGYSAGSSYRIFAEMMKLTWLFLFLSLEMIELN